MNERLLIYIVIIGFISYLLYQCYKKEVDSVILRSNPTNNKKNIDNKQLDMIKNDAYIQPLNLRSFNNINEIINRDVLDLIVFNKLKSKTSRSIIYSSLGLRQMLLFTYLGSTPNSNNQKSFEQIFGKNDKLMLAFHRDLNKHLISSGAGNLQYATGIWYDNQALQLTPYYQKQIACLSGCNTPIDKADIEDTIAIKTNGMINTFEYESIDETLLIINAIYFEFKIKADCKKSYIDRFVSWDGHESEVKYMNTIDNYLYLIDTTAQALLINYNSPFSLLLILPKNGEEPMAMTRSDINKTKSLMKKTKIDLYLPKIDYENVHPFIEPLESVGFSYITKSSYDRATINNTPLPIVQIVQKTKISMTEDEKYEGMVNLDNESSLPKVFRADHSFLYYFIYMPTKECIISGIFNSV